MSKLLKKLRASWLTWTAVIIVGLGFWGFVDCTILRFRAEAQVLAYGKLWKAKDRDGRTSKQTDYGRLLLKKGQKIEFREEAGRIRYRKLSVVWDRLDASACLQFVFRETDQGAYLFTVAPASSGGVQLAWRDAAGEQKLIARGRQALGKQNSMRRNIQVQLEFKAHGFSASINGKDTLRARLDAEEGGAYFLAAPNGSCVIRKMEIAGTSRNPGGGLQPFSEQENFASLQRTFPQNMISRFLIETVLILLSIFFFLRALCLGNPSIKEQFQAGIAFLFPLSLYYLLGLFKPVPVIIPLFCGLVFLGLILTLFALRNHISRTSPLGFIGIVRICFTVLLIAGFTVWIAGDYNLMIHEASLRVERMAQQKPAPPPYRADATFHLGPHNAETIEGGYRNAEIRAKVSLPADSILQVRLRTPSTERAQGVTFFLSTVGTFKTGFYLETVSDFKPIGGRSERWVKASDADLLIRMQGRDFEAWINGEEIAWATERLHPQGGVTMLAAHGFANVMDLEIEPIDAAESPVSTRLDRWIGAASPLVFLLVYSGLAACFLRIGFLRILGASAFGLAPLILGFSRLSPIGTLNDPLLAISILTACFIFFLFPLVQARGRLTVLKGFVLGCVILLGALGTFMVGRERAWPVNAETLSRMNLAQWSLDRLDKDLVHFQIPALRRWNHYLAQHDFCGRKYALNKAPGVKRIVALGTSSTYGYGTKEPFPRRIERLLEKAGYQVEMINGAYQGASGARVLQFFRNVLLDFSPDIVILSLFYNDAYALTQGDEAAYLARITHPYYRRSYLDSFSDRIREWQGAKRVKEMMQRFSLTNETPAVERGSDAPAVRFEKVLRAYAMLAEEERFDLILVKEPLSGGKDRLWKNEFYAAIDRVGEEFDLKVFDPTPWLNAAGGARLFRDDVHPFDTGNAVIARGLLPLVRDILDAEKGDENKEK